MVHRDHRTSGRPGPVVLGRLARRLADLVADGAPHLVVRVGATRHGVTDLTIAAAPGRMDDLVGWRSDPDAYAVAVAVSGQALGTKGPDDGRATVAVAHVVDRGGRTASATAPRAGSARHVGSHIVGGRVDDVCRRALGLPTAAEHGPSTAYWAGRLLVGLTRSTSLHGWADIADVATTTLGVLVDPDDPGRLAAALDLLGAAHDWRAIRAAVAAGAHRVDGIDEAAASWMDDGMFARWSVTALRRSAPPDDVLADLDAPTAAQLARVLRACGTVPRR